MINLLKKIRRNKGGFHLIEGLLVLAVLVALGFVGYRVYSNQTNNLANKASLNSDEEAGILSSNADYLTSEEKQDLATLNGQVDSEPATGEAETLSSDLDCNESPINSEPAIPTNAFNMYIFDHRTPDEIAHCEVNSGITLRLSGDMYGVDYRRMGAYWVGNLKFKKATTRTIETNSGWHRVTITINDEVVLDKNNPEGTRLDYTFPAGVSKVEVDFKSNSSYPEFVVKIVKEREIVTAKKASKVLKPILDRVDHEIWYVGMYTSKKENFVTHVNLEDSTKPIFLILSSYGPTTWNLKNYSGEITAVALASSELASDIVRLDNSIPRIYLNSFPSKDKIVRGCKATRKGTLRCSSVKPKVNFGNPYYSFMEDISELTGGHDLTGYSGRQEATRLRAPELILTPSIFEIIENHIEEHTI